MNYTSNDDNLALDAWTARSRSDLLNGRLQLLANCLDTALSFICHL